MDFLEKIRNLSEEELKETVKERIFELEKNADELNEKVDTIGYVIGHNPTNYKFDEYKSNPVSIIYIYNGYIPKGMRIVYGMYYDELFYLASNKGDYYYVDDDSYILDFCKFIKDKDLGTELEFFSYILEFCQNYFKKIEKIDRAEMYKMIYKKYRYYYEPKKEHVFTDFKDKGNAMCSEYTLMANNILNVFGFESNYALGKLNIEQGGNGDHAFNIVEYTEKSTGKKINAIMDYCSPVKIYDMNYNIIDSSPFIGILNVPNDKLIDYITKDDRELVFENYGYMIMGNSMHKIGYQRNRTYKISQYFTVGTTKVKRK